MTSKAERLLSQHLRAILIDQNTENNAFLYSEELTDILTDLEFYLSELLQNQDKFWKYESLDGVYPRKITKIGENEIELVGMALLISDQTLTPLYVHLKVNNENNYIESITCKIGEKTDQGLTKLPYGSNKASKYMHTLNLDTINWAWEVFQ